MDRSTPERPADGSRRHAAAGGANDGTPGREQGARLEEWLERYRVAWEERDPAGVADLFTVDAVYAETPFGDPFEGRDRIRRYWQDEVLSHREIEFGFSVLSIDPAVAHWWARFRRRGTRETTELDGIFLLGFATDGRCSSLREWWHARRRVSSA